MNQPQSLITGRVPLELGDEFRAFIARARFGRLSDHLSMALRMYLDNPPAFLAHARQPYPPGAPDAPHPQGTPNVEVP